MNLASLSTSDFKRIVKLLEQKEKLLAEVAEIDAALTGISTGKAPTKKAPKASAAPKKRGKRGALKEAILVVLKKAGAEGIAVKEIAAAVGSPAANIHAWFFNTSKKMPQLKKVGKAKWALVE